MSQRYFLTAESTYEDLRQALNTQLQYPNALGKSVFQTALQAPRDSFRRVLLAVDTAIPGYATIVAAITPLLASDAMEELDEATYLAAVASTASTGGGVTSYNDLTDKPSIPTTPADIGAASASHAHSAIDITDFATAVAAASPEEVLEFLTTANFPATGNSSYLYLATDASRAYRWTGSQYVEVGPGSSFVANHTHAASEITSGVLATARLGSGATATTFLRGDSTYADPVTYATLTQAQDYNSTSVAMNPARTLDALTGWAIVSPTTTGSTSGGQIAWQSMQCFCDSGSTAGGAATAYANAAGGITNLLSPQNANFDWTKRRYFAVRVNRNVVASSTGYLRVYFGFMNTSASGGQPTQRSVGFELRGTSSRLWVIAHNGTALTQTDSGFDVSGNSTSQDEYLIESSGGTVNVYINGTLRGTATGGPTAVDNSSNAGVNYQVGNGGTAARVAYFVSQGRFTI